MFACELRFVPLCPGDWLLETALEREGLSAGLVLRVVAGLGPVVVGRVETGLVGEGVGPVALLPWQGPERRSDDEGLGV